MTDGVGHGSDGGGLAARAGISVEGRSFGQQAWARFRKHKLAIVSSVMLVLVVVAFLIGPVVSQFTYDQVDVLSRLQGPNATHWFGTDELGRDLFVRTVKGGRTSIVIAAIVSVVTTAVGTLIGALSGYYGGGIDTLLSQLTNLFLIVPALVVLIVAARHFNSQPWQVGVLLGLLLWPQIARIVRGLFLQYRNQEFVLAARAAGARAPRIMFRHILPNTIGPIVVAATLLVGTAIILESTLSFLDLGPRPPATTLGTLVADAKGSMQDRPYELLLPAGFIVTLTLAINFLGDALRDALDPTHGSS